MSYTKYLKAGANPGMSRGRGYSMRGSYRGDGEGGSWTGRGGRGRGNSFAGPGRGRSNWYKEHPGGFEQRARYPSEGGGERYAGRGHVEDPGYRRYPRQEASGYSGRELGHHRSPEESPRKRMKTEHGYMQASSSRRSHEGSYSEYNRYSFEDKSYGEERRSYRDDRRNYREHSHGEHSGYSSRDDYSLRKERLEERGESSMMEGRHPPLRGGYRGRGLDRGRLRRVIRGVPRVVLVRRADGLVLKKRSIVDHPYSVRKRIITARSQEYLKKLRTQKFRRLREAEGEEEEEEEEEEKEEEIISDDEEKEEEHWDDLKVEDDDFDDFDDGAEDVKSLKEDKEETDKEAASKKKEEGEEKAKEGEEEDGEKETPKKPEAEKVEKPSVQVTIKHDSDSRAVNEDELAHLIPKHFIRLHCPHCNVRCITYKEYGIHLFSSKHANTMRKLALKHKLSLQRMRTQQRKNQREEEGEEDVDSPMHVFTYCPVCQLKYRSSREKHQSTSLHRMLRKFLTPYCRVCNMSFQSPMQYENHMCSVVHMQRKSKMDQRILRQKELDLEVEHEGGSGLDGEDKVLDLENFMILDSVGVVDETGDEAEGDSGQAKEKTDKSEKDERKKKEVRLGVEFIKKVEVLFCELCRRYLPRHDQPERAIALHCRKGYHLDCYRDDRAMRREAERIHRREMEKKKSEEAKKAPKKTENTTEKAAENGEKPDEPQTAVKNEKEADGAEENAKSSEEAGPMDTEAANEEPKQESGEGGEAEDLDSAMDDKLWADVDKDLGELLREVEPNSSAGAAEGESLPVAEMEEDKSSDEDEEDSRAEEEGRYDRFRYSEKGSAGGVVEEPTPENEATVTKAEVESEPVKEAPAEEESPKSDMKKETETEEADV